MPNINQYLQYCELAFASYAKDLLPATDNTPSYKRADISHTQAQKFNQSWQVLAQQDLPDGFSAVLFERVSDTPQLYQPQGRAHPLTTYPGIA